MDPNQGTDRSEDTLKKLPVDRVDFRTERKRPKQRVFQTRCNPKLNFKLIQSLRGYPQFRKLLCDLGLDCMLNLHISRLQRELCADLAHQVDVGKRVLVVHGTEISLTYESVTKIFGLQCAGLYEELIVQLTKDEQQHVCSKFKLEGTPMISQNCLWSHLDGASVFDAEFKGKLLLFFIGTLIRPTTNAHIHFREYIPMLQNIDNLSDFNWAKFLLDGLLEAVTTYQARGAKSLGGCVLYLQCISPLPWTHLDACMMSTPTLNNWTDERVSVILKLMREHGGIHSNRVTVQTSPIPTIGTVEKFVLPQLLMHDVLITRLRRRIDDAQFGIPELFQQLSRYVSHLTRRIARLEDTTRNSN